MARLKGTNVLNTTIRAHQHEDGYVLLFSDGYTVVNSLVQESVFSSMSRTGVGLWQATLADAYPCNLNYFNAVPQLYTGSTPAVVFFQLLGDNVGVKNTTTSLGSTPQVIHWMFCNSTGTPEDLPPNSGFKYEVGLQVSTSYYKESY